MNDNSATSTAPRPDEPLSVGSTGIDDSDGPACAMSTLTSEDMCALSASMNASDDRGYDDSWSDGCGFLSNLY